MSTSSPRLTLNVFKVFSVAEYIPDAWIPAYESMKESVVQMLTVMGVVPKKVDTSEGALLHVVD